MKHRNRPIGENPMGTVPVPKLMISMAAPMMLSMLVQALYNIVDSLYVSYIPDTAAIVEAGDKAVAALTLAFPVQLLIVALCTGTGVGINASLSRSLGEGNRKQASKIAGNAIVLSIAYFVLILLFGLFGVEAYINSQTTDPITAQFGISYLRIITVCSLGMTGFMCFEKLLQSTGKTVCSMIGQLVGSVTNIILDPVFIFGWFGIPAMGVAGAAVATVIGQFASCIAAMALHLWKNTELDRHPRMMKPDFKIIGKIYVVGGPAIAMQALTSVMTYGFNLILGTISESAITAYGIYFKLQSFIFMPSFGLNNACVPVISYNYGARQKKRIRQAIFSGLGIVSIIMLTGTLLLQCFSAQVVGWFDVSADATALSIQALRIITLGFLFAGVNVILQGACQALGNGIYSLLISLLRMIVVALPAAWLLSRLPNAKDVVWFAFPIAEASACAVAAALTITIYRRRTKTMTVSAQASL